MLKAARKVLILFTGQGSQYPGMPQWKGNPPNLQCFRPLFQRKPEMSIPIDLKTQIPTDSEKIHLTQYAQPAIFNLECMLYGQLEPYLKTVKTSFMGHSLGQYSAIVCSGRLSLSDGYDMVIERGRIMSEVGMIEVPFSMVAVMLRRDLSVDEFISIVKDDGGCDVANINSEKQVVLSGDSEAIQRVLKKANCRGLKLNVSAPFHSRYMEWASTNFQQYLMETFDEVGGEPGMTQTIQGFGDHNEVQIASERPCHDVICNTTGRPFDGTLQTLSKHIISPVLWHNSMQYVFSNEERRPDLIIEIGPKSTLIPLLSEEVKNSIPFAFVGKSDDLNQLI